MNREWFINVIETIVGPIPASGPRKDRMREELAAHLAASWEEECARGGDGSAAAERALRRLGDVDQLGRELQESVPRLERWLFTPLPGASRLESLDRALRRRDDETALRHAVRVTLGIIAAIAGAEAMLLPVLAAIKGRPQSDWTTTSIWAVGSLAVVAAGGIIFPLICDAMIRALDWERRSRLGVALYAALSGLVVIALGAGFAGIVSLDPRHGALFARFDWFRLLAMALFAPPTMIATAHTTYARRRGRSAWGVPDVPS